VVTLLFVRKWSTFVVDGSIDGGNDVYGGLMIDLGTLLQEPIELFINDIESDWLKDVFDSFTYGSRS
jgi:hypothetical protein